MQDNISYAYGSLLREPSPKVSSPQSIWNKIALHNMMWNTSEVFENFDGLKQLLTT